MFDPKKWIENSWNEDDSKIVSIAGEKAKIRRLKGTQWEQFLRAKNGVSEDSPTAIVLQYGLAKGFGDYTYEEMAKFYDASPVLADQIAGLIVEHTLQRLDAERQALEDAEKNSGTTATPSPSGDGAENTVKTPRPPESAEENCSNTNSSPD